ncbi:MAG: methyltransferase [Sphingomonas sp.]|uniref:class I SAM-dependent methyltransferase n=1 Tax=Sphingomonas sp. CD22 TaxID=3100214 RepID=UPI00120C8835|nr:methyltransferase [Sphingomonas sp. CD22]MEA1086036.1 methyltransferase [Sphingomonas sp. CD22]RZL54458.1 MAG: methyltransferase [Sphingomonas sp.]
MRLALSMFAAAALTTAVVAQDKAAPAGPAITRALADPARADQAGDDARRQAAAVLAFAGVKPGDTVVDYLPGAGYWTRIFTGVVGPKGKVYALWPAAGAKYAEKSLPALQARGLANVVAQVQPTDLPTAPQPVDLFWTVQNYHDIPNKGAGEPALRAFDAAVFQLLKKGGTYVVIDHADAPGTGLTGTETKHRIDPAAVRRQIEATGFRFVGASKVLANPADDHSKNVFDPAVRGKTDQFVLKFRKP